ncbi:hypothetical protein D3C87_486090 [compost metagenome]
MITTREIISACQVALINEKARHSIYKVLVPYENGLVLDHHIQEIFTFDNLKWFTYIDNERIDLGDYPEFYIGE